jgi:uncharacterized protein DUF5996
MQQNEAWPELPWREWASTCQALHRWSQVLGKVKLASTPLVNHWWNVTLQVTPWGLTTGLMPHGAAAFDMSFDFLRHRLVVSTSEGRNEHVPLRPTSVAQFHADVMRALERLGIDIHIWTMPSEIENAIPFEKDEEQREYDPSWVGNFMQVLRQVYRLFKQFRTRFIGKVSPVGFFWGGFDLAVTRFSGRAAPLLHSKTPNVAEWVMQEAYSHEVSSCGFWPGNGGYGRAAFFCYAYPEPPNFAARAMAAGGAFYDRDLGMFILPYDELRISADPDRLLLTFLQETYEAAADLAQWNRASLERRP